MTFIIRTAVVEDVDAILCIQKSSYTDELIEDKKIFETVINLGFSYLALNVDGEAVGYLLTHGIDDISVPPSLHHIDTLHFCKSNQEYWHIHDMTVVPEYRRLGVAKDLLNRFFTDLPNIKEISLVSINDQSHLFWGRYGFVEIHCHQNILDSYGQKNAQYMILEN